ncbi:EFR1 family ferrodoxin [Clostridium sp.]|jgi:ferredoxin|uniref:EFR1 family ferrodoxin n=1 Tax=Clostridium sp. TaxID=1506 RepID=UPI003A3A989E
MNGVLYYFSGTGNTKWVADKFKVAFKSYNIDLKLINIEDKEKVKNQASKKCDFIVVGSPVHAEFPPKIMCDFLNKLKFQDKNIKAIVYSTQGGKSSACSRFMSKCLRKKGYKVLEQICIKMPNNYYFSVGKKPSKNSIKILLSNAEKKIQYIVKNFIENKYIIESNNELRLQFSKILCNFFRKSIPKISKNIASTKDCNKCGLCLMNCPQNNITFENGYAIFHSKCILCMRCIHICPINAITYKNKSVEQTQKDIMKSLDIHK